jgi:hypothetical protein
VCVLGYCVLPIVISTILNQIFVFLPAYLKFVIAAVAWLWSTTSSISFMGALLPVDRKELGIYPIAIFYLFLAWFSVLA